MRPGIGDSEDLNRARCGLWEEFAVVVTVGAFLAALCSGVAGIGFEAAEIDGLVMPELRAQLDVAHQSVNRGEWSRGLAHSNAVLMLQGLDYSVDLNQVPEPDRKKCIESLEAAMSQWSGALGDQIRFNRVESGGIVIIFQPDLSSRGRAVGGHTKWRRDVRIAPSGELQPVLEASIWIRTLQPGGRPMSFDHLRHIASHELGHVLGLADSPRIGDVMGPLDLGRPVKSIGKREIEALRAIRERALELRRECLVSALQELEGYNLARAAR